ncbi:hypothetical protein MYX82_10720, partial [Acidobacteria bacterium AH-259-D05]|nr:hypothetical protein [Acidobacteria bacterium AH-259-D05]
FPGGARATKRLVWVSREGMETPITQEQRAFENPRISPDETQVAVDILDNIWVYDLNRDSLNRLTFEGPLNRSPIWSPDGKWIAFRSTRDGQSNLYRKPADGSGSAERLTTSQFLQASLSWSPDGSALAIHEVRPQTGMDLLALTIDSDEEPQILVNSPGTDCCAHFSPDGRWLAYVSDELGRNHVYVRPYPEPDVKWLVSEEEGGGEPVWSPDGTELFYRTGTRLMVVAVETEPSFQAGKPRVLFEGVYATNPLLQGHRYYDISPDGQRFLMVKNVDRDEEAQINIVLNWFEELKRLVPTDN